MACATNKAMKEDRETKKAKLESARKKHVQHKLEVEYANLDTREKKQAELVRMHAEEEDHFKMAEKEVIELKERMFKSSQELFNLRSKERDLIAEIAGGQSQNKNLASKIKTLDGQVVKQQEVAYNSDFQI